MTTDQASREAIVPQFEKGTIQHLVKRLIPSIQLNIADLLCEDYDPEDISVNEEFINTVYSALTDCSDQLKAALTHANTEMEKMREALQEWWFEATGQFDKKTCGHMFTCVCVSDRVRAVLEKDVKS